MNIGKFLVSLGHIYPPKKEGFPCPTIIRSREPFSTSVGCGAETAEEVAADIDFCKSIGERSTTKRSPGNWF